MNHFEYYVFALIVLIVGFLIVKKVATCLFKTVVIVIVLAILAGIYFLASFFPFTTTTYFRSIRRAYR